MISVVGLVACFPALAFHDDGVAHCNGCHTMHNSQDGAAMNFNATGTGQGTPPGTGFFNNDLLLFQNKSDVCLRCHAGQDSYHVWADDVLTPGQEHGAGNFVWLEEDNINDGHRGGAGTCTVLCGPDPTDTCDSEVDCLDPDGDPGTADGGAWTWGAQAIPGTSAGHSLQSGIKGTVFDTILSTAPGGTYPNTELNCASCHDPHGNDGFRLLYKAGQTMTLSGGATFTWNSTIDATGIGLFGPTAFERNDNHNAYRDGYSDWCGNCHGSFHEGSVESLHPSGEPLDTEQIASYNFYDGTSDCIANAPSGGNPCGSGDQLTSYLAMVPFESTANTSTSSLVGATAASKVVCVSCHRAHASSAPDAGRWDFNVTGLAEDGHESNTYAMPNPYDEFQRSLCNKCHSQDEYDALVNFTP